jgi:diguanylate cyclase (GGDEF)-like protein
LGVFDYVEALKRESRDCESLLDGASEIFRRTAIDELLETTVRRISDKFLPTFMVFLWKPYAARDDLVVKAYRNFKAADINCALADFGPFAEFFRKYPGPISYELFAYQIDDPALTAPLEALRPAIVVPVIGPSGLYGLILVGPKVLDEQYTPRELAYLDRLMGFASIALQNHLHYEHSVRDPKTGLFNHGFFMARLNEEIARARRAGSTLAVIVMDVDHFKAFNDGFGHLAGDAVLEGLAATLRSNIRDADVLARFGGEEFTALLPSANRTQAWEVAERLRVAVSNLSVPWTTPLPPVAMSTGVAVFNPADPIVAATLLSRADEALYQAKERGRNRTMVWGTGLLFRTMVRRTGE